MSAAAASQSKELYDISQPRYDLSTYTGRLRYFISATSPLTLLASSARLEEAVKNVKDVDERIKKSAGGVWVDGAQREKYWKDKQLVDSSIHPDTGKPVPLPFRMSAFVPTNLVIVAGMLAPNPTLRQTIFWQWANQTLNVAVNSANANKSTPLSNSELAASYFAATGSSVGIAFALTRVVPKLNVGATTKVLLGRMVPFASVVFAGLVNISTMRYKEIVNGITVRAKTVEGVGLLPEEERHEVGPKSRLAGTLAVAQTAASRVGTNIPTLILPPLILTSLARRGVFANPRGKIIEQATSLALAGGSLLVFLPPAIAVFPQRATVSARTLWGEEVVRDKEGRRVLEVEFNRGL